MSISLPSAASIPSRTSGFSPLAVFYDAKATTSTQTSRPFHEIQYRWNFGDSTSGNWSYGARSTVSRNIAYGPEAAHIHRADGSGGTDTVILTGFDGVDVSQVTMDIVSTATDSEFATTDTIAVANGTLPVAGVDGVPANATCQMQASLATISGYLTDGKRVLLKHDDTWSSGTLTLTGNNALLGMYGSGAKPIITTNVVVAGGTPMSNLVIQDIEVSGSGSGSGIAAGGTCDFLTMLRLNVHDYADCIAFDNSKLGGDPIPDHWFLHDSIVDDAAGYNIIADLTRISTQGNSITDNPTFFGIRFGYWDGLVLSYNNITNHDLSAVTLRAPDFDAGGPSIPPGTVSQYAVVSENYLAGGANSSSGSLIFSIMPTDAVHDERCENVIFERNWLAAISANVTGGGLKVNGENSTVRNNLFDMTGVTAGISALYGGLLGVEPTPTRMDVLNNSIVTNSTGGFTGVGYNTFSGSASLCYNNIVYAPNASSPTVVSDSGSHATKLTNSATATTNPGFPTFPWATIADIIPSNTPFLAGGTDTDLWMDIQERSRYGVPYSIGAYQTTEGTYPWDAAADEFFALNESEWFVMEPQTNPSTISRW